MAVSAWAGPVTATTFAAPVEPSGLFAGAGNVSALRVGTASVSSVRLGSGQVWPTITAPAAVAYPTDAGVINLQAAPYNVVPDSSAAATANTAAIRQAMTDHAWKDADATHSQVARNAPRTLYVGEGTIWVNDSLTAPGSSLCIQGAGRTLTTIKLTSNATGYSSSGTPKYLLQTGTAQAEGNAAFSNYVRDLTIDVGTGNPGAVGLRPDIANCGAVQRVTVRSSDPGKVGHRGIELESTSGPAFVQDVAVEGFTTGIYAGTSTVNNWVMCGITLTGQLATGILNASRSLQIEDLTVTGAPKAIQHVNETAATILVDATLSGTGTGPAITLPDPGFLWMRDVTVSGYTNVVTHGSTARFTGASTVQEWGTVPYRVGTTSTAYTEASTYHSLRLPATKAPQPPVTDPATWVTMANVATYRNTGVDATAAIQAVLNNPATVDFYLPYGSYTISGTLVVGGNVRRINFCFSNIAAAVGAVIRIDTGTAATVWLDDFTYNRTLQHNSSATLVARNVALGPKFRTGSSATGPFFVDNSGSFADMQITQPISFFGRQMNREIPGEVWSGGVTARIFGDNAEQGTGDNLGQILISGGSTVEVLGGAVDGVNIAAGTWPDNGQAIVDVTDSTVCYLMTSEMRPGSYVGEWLIDRDGASVVGRVSDAHVSKFTLPSGTQRIMTPLYGV